MWEHAGVERSGEEVSEGLRKLSELESQLEGSLALSHDAAGYHMELQEAIETRLMFRVARLIMSAAVTREETRGSHVRLDYPEQDQAWKTNLVLRNREDRVVCERRESQQGRGDA
jgi:succinate dehydrogenase/fumarate reductase flavoprotein subunit